MDNWIPLANIQPFNVDDINCTSAVLCCHSLPPLRLIPSNYVAQGKFTSLYNIAVAVHSCTRVCDKRERHFYWKSIAVWQTVARLHWNYQNSQNGQFII